MYNPTRLVILHTLPNLHRQPIQYTDQRHPNTIQIHNTTTIIFVPEFYKTGQSVVNHNALTRSFWSMRCDPQRIDQFCEI